MRLPLFFLKDTLSITDASTFITVVLLLIFVIIHLVKFMVEAFTGRRFRW